MEEETKQIDGREIVKTFFRCPHCNKVYVVCYDDKSTLALKKQIRKRVANLGTIKDKNKYIAELKNIKKKQKRLSRDMKILEAKMEQVEKEEGRK